MATHPSLRVEVDDADVKATFERVAAAGGDASTFLHAVGGYLLTSTQRRFETRTGPGGKAWPQLAPRTARERVRLGYGTTNILRRTGMLYGSYTYVVSPDAVEAGTNNPYAGIHQFGGEIRQYARSQQIFQHYDPKTDHYDPRFRKRSRSNFARWVAIGEHTITIPARPALGIDEADRAAIVETGEDWLASLVGGRR